MAHVRTKPTPAQLIKRGLLTTVCGPVVALVGFALSRTIGQIVGPGFIDGFLSGITTVGMLMLPGGLVIALAGFIAKKRGQSVEPNTNETSGDFREGSGQ